METALVNHLERWSIDRREIYVVLDGINSMVVFEEK